MAVWLLLLILCDASRANGINVPTAKGQIVLGDGHVADISPDSNGDQWCYSRLASNIFRFFKINCNMLQKLSWSSVTTMEQRHGVSSSTSLNQHSLSRRILRKSPPTKYPPSGANPSGRIVPSAPTPAPVPAPAPAPHPITGH